MATPNVIVVDNEALRDIAARHFDNRVLLYPLCSFPRDHLSHFPYLHPFHDGNRHHLCLDSSKRVIAAASVCEEEQGGQTYHKMYGLSVVPELRQQGLAGHLMRSVFALAAAANDTGITTTPFTAKGRRYLAPLIARLHNSEFPQLPVMYPGVTYPVQGHKSYHVSFRLGIFTKLTFS